MKIVTTPWYNTLLKLIADSTDEIFLIAPYIGPGMIEAIVESLRASKLRILTKIDTNDLSGRITLRSLQFLYNLKTPTLSSEIEIRLIKNLHAKVFIFDKKKAVITSSNLTQTGLTNNIEIGVLIENSKLIQEIVDIFERYWELAEKIDFQYLKELEEIQEDITNIVSHASIIKSEASPPKFSIGRRVKPLGKDIPLISQKKSKNKLAREIAIALSQKEMDKDEMLRLFMEYNKKYGTKVALRNGFRYSFDSDAPFETAGIYYKNMIKIDKKFKQDFEKNLANTFRNLILGTGSLSRYGLEIANIPQYLEYRKLFSEYFDINPPKHRDILVALSKKLSYITQNPVYIIRIINIFLPFTIYPDVKEELKKMLLTILDAIKNERTKLKKKNQSKRRNYLLEIEENIMQALEFVK